MRYQSFDPTPALKEFVWNYTVIHLQFESADLVPAKHRAPKAEQKIVFYLKGSVDLFDLKSGKAGTPPSVSIYTHQLERRVLRVSAEFFAIVVYLKPGTLYRLLGFPMTEFDQQYFDAEIFLGNEIKVVREKLADAKSIAAMIAIIEELLTKKCIRLQEKASVDQVASNVMINPATFSLDRMANDACLSTKQFYRKFTQRIGISPKYFSRLSRFNQAYQYKLSNPGISWSSIAQEFAYTDYHHLEKEFKEFLGLTPGEWLKAELAAPERILKLR
jgi:AraC-like DNA-binding protein